MVVMGLSSETAAELRGTPADELLDAHFGLGIDVRHEFGLWDGNAELMASCGEETGVGGDWGRVYILHFW